MKFIVPIKKQSLLAIAITLTIILTRFLVFNPSSYYFFADEGRYKTLISGIEEGSKNRNLLLPVRAPFEMNGRPGFGFFYFLPALLEWKSPQIQFGAFFSVLCNIVLMVVFYFIVKFIQSTRAALLATIFLTFSITSLVYIRHIVPYDIGLVLLLLSLYVYLHTKKPLLFGLLVGISFLTYPSYIFYLIPIPFLIWLYHEKPRSKRPVLLFFFGFIIVVLFVQFFSLLIGATSYFQSLKAISIDTSGQKDKILFFSFINEYILSNDGIWGLDLALVVFLGFKLRSEKKFQIISVYLILVLLIFEVVSHLIVIVPMYARTMRPYYMALLVFSALVLDRLCEKTFKKNATLSILLYFLVLTITILNWWPRFINFRNLIYPSQFKQEVVNYLREKYKNYKVDENTYFKEKYADSKVGELWSHNYLGVDKLPDPNYYDKQVEPGKYYIVNAWLLYPFFGNFGLDPLFKNCKKEIIIEKPHPLSAFKPYGLEGFSREMREQLINDPLKYQLLYCKSI